MPGRRAALAGLVAAGVALRARLMVSRPGGFLGYPDAVTYVIAARGPLFWSPYRPAGYPLLLRALRRVDGRLATTIAVQHATGVTSALVLARLTRRAVHRPGLALLPAGVVLLGGTQILLEHSVLSESTYTLLTVAALDAAARAVDGERRSVWLGAAGGATGAAATVRSSGILAVPALAAWAATLPAARRRDRIRHALTVLGAAALPLLAYLERAHAATGHRGLTRTAGLTLYARMAPLADCRRFSPPPGTEELCEDTAPSGRPNATWYMFDWEGSPAIRVFGVPPYPRGPGPLSAYRWEADARLRSFALAILRHQPGNYLRSLGPGLRNYVRPSPRPPAALGWDHDRLVRELRDPGFEERARPEALAYYAAAGPPDGERALERYARTARLEGGPTAALALLAAAGVALSHDDERPTATLLTGTTLAMAVALVATLFYDARYATPLYGPLAAGAALGADRLCDAFSARRAGSG